MAGDEMAGLGRGAGGRRARGSLITDLRSIGLGSRGRVASACACARCRAVLCSAARAQTKRSAGVQPRGQPPRPVLACAARVCVLRRGDVYCRGASAAPTLPLRSTRPGTGCARQPRQRRTCGRRPQMRRRRLRARRLHGRRTAGPAHTAAPCACPCSAAPQQAQPQRPVAPARQRRHASAAAPGSSSPSAAGQSVDAGVRACVRAGTRLVPPPSGFRGQSVRRPTQRERERPNPNRPRLCPPLPLHRCRHRRPLARGPCPCPSIGSRRTQTHLHRAARQPGTRMRAPTRRVLSCCPPAGCPPTARGRSRRSLLAGSGRSLSLSRRGQIRIEDTHSQHAAPHITPLAGLRSASQVPTPGAGVRTPPPSAPRSIPQLPQRLAPIRTESAPSCLRAAAATLGCLSSATVRILSAQ